MLRKGQKSLEMIIGLVILLVVAGVVISTFLNQFEDNPGNQYQDTLQKEEIKKTCQSKCSEYKSSSGGEKGKSAAIDYCTSTFSYDEDGDGILSEAAGTLYNTYCEDGVKCFNLNTCEIGQDTLDAERCKEIMMNYYKGELEQDEAEANQSIAEWYQPNGKKDKTIGSCGLEEVDQVTWYSDNFEGLTE
jgi:hypothetical protein